MRTRPALLLVAIGAVVTGCAPQQPNSYQQVMARTNALTTRYDAEQAERETRPKWKASCKPNRMTDKVDCELSLKIENLRTGPIVSGTLVSFDGGKSWSVITSPLPLTFIMRVDQNPAITFKCLGTAVGCEPVGVSGEAITQELQNGTKLAVQLQTTRGGNIDRDLPIQGFDEALAEVRSKVGSPTS